MRELQVTITERGQVTLPVEIRRRLGLKPRDKVAFVIDEGEIRVERPAFSFATLKGSVKALSRPEDLEEISRLAKEDKAARTVEEMQRE